MDTHACSPGAGDVVQASLGTAPGFSFVFAVLGSISIVGCLQLWIRAFSRVRLHRQQRLLADTISANLALRLKAVLCLWGFGDIAERVEQIVHLSGAGALS